MIDLIIQGRKATLQDAHEFLGVKKRRGEPVRVCLNRNAQASVVVSSRAGFAELRARLRESTSFARASEALDRLEREVTKTIAFPTPDEAMQQTTGEIGLAWREGLKVIVSGDGIVGIRTRTSPPQEKIGLRAVAVEIAALSAARRACG